MDSKRTAGKETCAATATSAPYGMWHMACGTQPMARAIAPPLMTSTFTGTPPQQCKSS